MRIEVLNGMQGLSRVNLNGVTDLTSFVPDGYSLNGLSRVNLNGLSRVNLNGFVLNGFDVQDYMEECAYRGYDPTVPGLQGYMLNGKAERQARRAARKQKRSDRREGRAERKENRIQERADRRERRGERHDARLARKDTRMQTRADKIANRGGLFDKIGNAAESFTDKAGDIFGGGGSDLAMMDDRAADYYFEDEASEKGLFGPPALFEDPIGWFGSKKVPTINKIAVAGAGVVAVDALTGGNIILQRVGVMKKKKK